MNRYGLEALLLALALGLSALAVRRAAPIDSSAVAVPVPPAAGRRTGTAHSASVASAAATLVNANPFRLSRTPAQLRVGQPIAIGAAMPDATPMKVRPSFLVKAIAGGPPWSALIEGLPQTTGPTVVREGWQQGDFAVTSISRDTVVVTARDTVWKLTMKREIP